MSKVEIHSNVFNPVYLRRLDDQTPTQIFYGGSASGKSYFAVGQRVIYDLLNGGRNYLVCRQVARTIKNSVYNEVTKTIKAWGVQSLFHVNKSEFTITCNNGYQILFAGLDDVEKIKSITSEKGVITDIVIEEATETDRESVKQLDKRLRGGSDKVVKRTTLLFNPILKTHWIYQDLFAPIGWADGQTEYHDDNLSILKTTHKDNKFLTVQDHLKLENEKDEYFYSVYTLGNWGILGDVIFKNIHIADLNDPEDPYYLPENQRTNRRAGLDFGFSSDPAAMPSIHFDKMRKRIYIYDELYERGLTNQELANAVLSKIGGDRVVCDSAEPKSIQELQTAGVSASSAKKGKDSINFGIQWLQGYEIIIDKSCVNAQREFTTYHWKKNKDGDSMRIPVDKDNHCFSPESLVYTLDGVKRIDELVGTSGYVYSIDGKLEKYSDVRITRKNAEVVSILFEDGNIITVTPDHLLLNAKNKWVRAENVYPGYMIQSVILNKKDNLNGKSDIQREDLLSISWGKILIKIREKIASCCLGILQWENTKRNACSSQRRELPKQRYIKFGIDNTGKALNETHDTGKERACDFTYGRNSPNGKYMAFLGGGAPMAFRAWQSLLEKHSICRDGVWSLSQKIFDAKTRSLKILLSKLQNEGEAKKVVGTSRGFRSITYNMEVENTHCLLVNGVIAHNCIDATRYALEDDMDNGWLVY